MPSEVAAATDLERRKQVRLRLRTDLGVNPAKYEGRTWYILKDPVSLRYYRFKDHEYFLLQQMNGQHTLDDAQKAFEKQFPPDRLSLEDLEQFGQQLLKSGLVQNESPQAGRALFEQRVERKRTEMMQTLTNVLCIRLPIFDPEKLLIRMLPWVRFMFTTGFLLASVLVMLAAILLVLTHFQTFRDRLPSYRDFFNVKTVIYLWVALGAVKVIHEFGHGLSCKAFGGEVHEMGFLVLCFSPAMYCNVSDAWTLPSKWHRIIIGGAGIYVELMIAAVATFIWWNTPGQGLVNQMALSLMVVCSVSTVLFNGNPLMRYDGYYVLSDWLEIPNLRDRANRYLKRLAMEHCLGIEMQPEPYMELWRRVLFVTFAVVSYIYRWAITFIILTFMATFLKPYKLEIISNMLALVAGGSMVGWPLWRLAKGIHKRGRLPEMKPVRTTLSAAVLAALLLAFFLVPLPVSRVRQTGMVQMQPQASVAVHLAVEGILEKVHVREGQQVRRGAVLATFHSLELKQEEDRAWTEYLTQDKLAEAYNAQLTTRVDPDEGHTLLISKTKAESERDRARQRWRQVREEMRTQLTLVAPRDGVVMGLPTPDEVGKRWEKSLARPFCTVGDPTRLRILAPLSPDDYNLVRDNLEKARAHKQDLAVTVRVHGRGDSTWEGRVSQLPESAAQEVPPALTNKLGGPLAAKPGGDPHKPQPQSQVYLVGIDLLDPDHAICPGQLAQVKIHCEYHSCAWWVWRTLSKTFDLGLL